MSPSAAATEIQLRKARGGHGFVLRLVIPTLLLGVGVSTAAHLQEAYGEVLPSALISCAACALLTMFLKRSMQASLWTWILLAVFLLGFYAKANTMAGRLGTYKFQLYYAQEMGWLTADDFVEGLKWTTVGFLTFCVTAAALLHITPRANMNWQAAWHRLQPRGDRIIWLLLLLAGTFGITWALPPLLGFGQMGVEHQTLPFRLDALITRTRLDVIPVLCLLSIWLLDRKGWKHLWVISVLLYIAFSVGDSFMRGSRASVAQAMVPMCLLWLLSNTLTRSRTLAIALAVPLVLVTFPFLTSIRVARMNGHAVDAETLRAGFDDLRSLEALGSYIDAMTGRFQGFDGLLHNLDYGDDAYDSSRLLWIADSSQLVFHQTHRVVGISDDVIEGRSPGLLGGFLIVGGFAGLAPLIVLYTILVWLLWQGLGSLQIAPVALSFMAARLLEYTGEGTFGVQHPIAGLVAIAIASMVFRWIACPRAVASIARCPLPTTNAWKPILPQGSR